MKGLKINLSPSFCEIELIKNKIMSNNIIKSKQIKIKEVKDLTRNLTADENHSVIYFYNNSWYIGKLPANNLNDVVNSGDEAGKNIKIKNVEFGRRGDNTILLGRLSLKDNVSGSHIISIGDSALEKNMTGSNLVVIGHNSYSKSTNKSDVVVIGNNTAKNNEGQNLILIGNKIEFTNNNVNDSIILGNNLNLDDASGKFVVGTSNERVLILGDFVKKNIEFKSSITVTSKIKQLVRSNYIGTGGEILIRDEFGEYQVISKPTNKSILVSDGISIFWEEVLVNN